VLESVNDHRRTSVAIAPGVYIHGLGPSKPGGRHAGRQRRRMSERTAGGRRSLVLAGLREFLYGMTGHEFARHAVATRASLETLFMVTCLGDMIGLPVMPPYYSLRLLPFVVPEIATWKRRVLRERQFSDEHDFELHGV
jgi:hypothetical protein